MLNLVYIKCTTIINNKKAICQASFYKNIQINKHLPGNKVLFSSIKEKVLVYKIE